MGTYADIGKYMTKFFLEREMLQAKFAEKFKTRVLCSISFNFFLPKIVPFVRKCGKKLCRAGQATDSYMTHAHYMLDT